VEKKRCGIFFCFALLTASELTALVYLRAHAAASRAETTRRVGVCVSQSAGCAADYLSCMMCDAVAQKIPTPVPSFGMLCYLRGGV
jgi:hypothetical protein